RTRRGSEICPKAIDRQTEEARQPREDGTAVEMLGDDHGRQHRERTHQGRNRAGQSRQAILRCHPERRPGGLREVAERSPIMHAMTYHPGDPDWRWLASAAIVAIPYAWFDPDPATVLFAAVVGIVVYHVVWRRT